MEGGSRYIYIYVYIVKREDEKNRGGKYINKVSQKY